MQTSGIMEEIRKLLSQGMSSGEVIGLGYAPGTVYKVQRQLRKQGWGGDAGLPKARGAAPEAAPPHPEAEIARLQQRIPSLEVELAAAESLRFQLDQAEARIAELEAEAAATLSETVGSLQREVQFWQDKAAETQNAAEDAHLQLTEAHAEIHTLRPLAIWAGHPCCVCGEPTDGMVDESMAAKLLERTGHRDCLENAGMKKVTFGSLALSPNSIVLADEPQGLWIT